jgi:hypothetical protein
MFEISILCVIVLAAGYWVALWLMGRHDDVLHGDFVHAEPQPELQPAPVPTMHVPTVHVPAAQAADPDSLQSLLTAIKRDLKDAAQL